MTVCIAAISAWAPSGSAIVAASDRMITIGDFIQFEHDMAKAWFVTPKILALAAGDTGRSTVMRQRLVSMFKLGADSVSDVVLAAMDIYAELRQDQINREIFIPRGITIDQFYAGGLQTNFQTHMAVGIDNEVVSYDYGVELLIAGTDGEGAHIFTVGNPGISSDYGHIGYAAIGSGALQAMQSLIGLRHSGFRSFFETIYAVYASKRKAEVTPGVGKEIDFVLIMPDTFSILTAEQLNKLQGAYEGFGQPAREEIFRKIVELELFGPAPPQEGGQASEGANQEPSGDSKPVSDTVQAQSNPVPESDSTAESTGGQEETDGTGT